MRSRVALRVPVLLLAAFAARGAPSVGDADIGRLRAWELPAYTLIGEDGSDPRRIVQSLANSERVLSKLLATPVKPTMVPTTVWLVPRRLWTRYLAPSHAIAGEFVPRRFANTLVINADVGRGRLPAGVQHEYTHFFLRTQWGGLYPLWFDEGMAELMRMAKVRARRAEFEIPDSRQPDWIAMSRLFELDKGSREYLEAPGTAAVHRESWALVHRGLLGGGTFGDQMFAYLAAINRLVPVEQAGPDSFGMTFDQLDASMKDYASRRTFAVGSLNFDNVSPPTLPRGRLLARGEALEMLAAVALDTGFSPENVGEVIAAADGASPGAPRVAILKLRLAVRDRRDAEALQLGRALAANRDMPVLRDTGLALFERVREPDLENAPSNVVREEFESAALALLDRALRIDAGDAPAAWGYALLAVRRREDVDTALERLAAARARMTGHPDLAEATALALEARGEEAAMMPFLLDALRNTSSAQQRARAARRIADLRIKERAEAPQ